MHPTTPTLAIRLYWPLFRQLLLTFAAIYFVGGAIMFSVMLLQNFDVATPLSVASTALAIALVAKLIVRESF